MRPAGMAGKIKIADGLFGLRQLRSQGADIVHKVSLELIFPRTKVIEHIALLLTESNHGPFVKDHIVIQRVHLVRALFDESSRLFHSHTFPIARAAKQLYLPETRFIKSKAQSSRKGPSAKLQKCRDPALARTPRKRCLELEVYLEL